MELRVTEPQMVEIKNEERFYTDRLGALTLLLLFILIQGIFMFGVILVLRNFASPPPVFFPATNQGQLLIETALNKPNLNENEILNWAAQAMMEVNTFNFVNYETVILKNKKYFTTEGYESYQNELKETKILERMLEKKLVLTAVPTDAPQITKEGELAGRYLWKVKVPMEFRFRSVKTVMTNPGTITLLIMRVPTIQSPTGIAILKIDVETRSI
jgi:intracellular multiplication protein IcmL